MTTSLKSISSGSQPLLKGHLLLESINLRENRLRRYAIIVSELPLKNPLYLVSTTWGRLNSRTQNKKQIFENKEQLEKHLHSLLMLRKRNGYTITELSDDFPALDVLALFKPSHPFQHQLQLFQNLG